MVAHLVLFRFKPECRDQMDEAIVRLKGMLGKVEVLRDLKAGKDFLHSGRSYDLGLVALFDDRHALEVYDGHKDHVPVKQFIGPLVEQSVAVDFDY